MGLSCAYGPGVAGGELRSRFFGGGVGGPGALSQHSWRLYIRWHGHYCHMCVDISNPPYLSIGRSISYIPLCPLLFPNKFNAQ